MGVSKSWNLYLVSALLHWSFLCDNAERDMSWQRQLCYYPQKDRDACHQSVWRTSSIGATALMHAKEEPYDGRVDKGPSGCVYSPCPSPSFN